MNNDRDFAQSALCVTLRGYLIENLISEKTPDLLFWGGVGPPLGAIAGCFRQPVCTWTFPLSDGARPAD